jgi:hypothetical protein
MVARGLVIFSYRLMTANAVESDQDARALAIADATPQLTEQARDWRIFLEGAYDVFSKPDVNGAFQSSRLSLDIHYDGSLTPDWRLVMADRVDADFPKQETQENDINTLKDAYLSWQVRQSTILDLGRINVRNGVAFGYNPTDYFGVEAVRSVVSIDPESLRDNRQGSVMFRQQSLWSTGSVTTLYSPKISDHANNGGFDPDWGATNNEARWLVAISQKIGSTTNPQLLFYKEESSPLQIGFNLSSVIGDFVVAYVEWSGGRSDSLLSQALARQAMPHADDTEFRSHLSTGVTFTTAKKLIFTLELEYNGSGLNKAAWRNLMGGSFDNTYLLYRNWLQLALEPPTKEAAFFYATWQDVAINHLDLAAMERIDAVDHSRLSWLEWRYHLTHIELALQWQVNTGQSLSDYGALPQRRNWQGILRYYF